VAVVRYVTTVLVEELLEELELDELEFGDAELELAPVADETEEKVVIVGGVPEPVSVLVEVADVLDAVELEDEELE